MRCERGDADTLTCHFAISAVEVTCMADSYGTAYKLGIRKLLGYCTRAASTSTLNEDGAQKGSSWQKACRRLPWRSTSDHLPVRARQIGLGSRCHHESVAAALGHFMISNCLDGARTG